MEILINGEPVTDDRLKTIRSLPLLVQSINRLLCEHEEIMIRVTADGKDVEFWDESSLDLSRTQRIEIHSIPVKEYAIGSLGDLGEYTGRYLSVLRNAEAICQKDSFPALRQKLIEGLDYILTIIEMADKVLELKMSAERYDMRTGEQMLTEVRRHQGRISEGENLDAIRPAITELEFTLTDWLKFLETLLRRYADMQAEIGPDEVIQAAAGRQAEALDRLHTEIKSIIDNLYAGRLAKSMEQFQGEIRVLQDSLVYLQKLRGAGRIHYMRLESDSLSFSQKISKFAGVLNELSDSMRGGDTVLMRDLLEYEILPFITYLRQIYGQISSPSSTGPKE